MIESSPVNTHTLPKTFCILLLSFVMVQNQTYVNNVFCHSSCIDYIGTCFDTSATGCYVCAPSIYKDKDFTNPSNPCAVKNQRRIMFNQLDSSSALSLNGFSTSNPNLFTCGGFPFSGKYINSDYIQKNFTGMNTEHYELVIRFNVGYFGSWGLSDNLQLEINDGVSSTYHTWGYSCGRNVIGVSSIDDVQNLCSAAGTDCVKVKELTIQHNSSYVYLKWTSLTSQNDPIVQSWGIKDILITAKTCHRYCDKCFGESVNECLTCSPGYFLRGNACVQKCPRLSVPTTQECVDTCPNKYYHNPLNDYCETCLDGCSLCTGEAHCLLWENQEVSPAGGVWYDKMELWIIMIIAGVGVIGLIVWKFLIKKYLFKDQDLSTGSEDENQKNSKSSRSSSNSGELNQFKNTETNLTNQLWIVDAENLDPVKVDVRRRKKRKADMEQTMNNSEMQL